jgi:hypothetical protein
MTTGMLVTSGFSHDGMELQPADALLECPCHSDRIRSGPSQVCSITRPKSKTMRATTRGARPASEVSSNDVTTSTAIIWIRHCIPRSSCCKSLRARALPLPRPSALWEIELKYICSSTEAD